MPSSAKSKMISYQLDGTPLEKSDLLIVWGHGWGRDRSAFSELVDRLSSVSHLRLDFPGFGLSPLPETCWGSAEYADACAELLTSLPHVEKMVWVGHSFGGRVGIQLAARHPDLCTALCLIATPGVAIERSFSNKLWIKGRISLFKILKPLMRLFGKNGERFLQRLGSSDYRQAGALKGVFIKIVNEELSDIAQKICCPTLLLYGEKDRDVPPAVGEKMAQLIPAAELTVFIDHDHHSLLSSGQHLLLKRLMKFLKRL